MFSFLKRIFGLNPSTNSKSPRQLRAESIETLEPMVLLSATPFGDGEQIENPEDVTEVSVETQGSSGSQDNGQGDVLDGLGASSESSSGGQDTDTEPGRSAQRNANAPIVSGNSQSNQGQDPPVRAAEELSQGTSNPGNEVPVNLDGLTAAELQALSQSQGSEPIQAEEKQVEQSEEPREEARAEPSNNSNRDSNPRSATENERPVAEQPNPSTSESSPTPEAPADGGGDAESTPRELPRTPEGTNPGSTVRANTPSASNGGIAPPAFGVSDEPDTPTPAVPPANPVAQNNTPERDESKGSDGGKDKKKKSDGGRDKKSDGGKDKKTDGGKDKKSDGGKDKKSDGGKDKKSDGGKDKKSDGGKDKKSDGGKDKKSDGGKDKKSDGGKDKKKKK